MVPLDKAVSQAKVAEGQNDEQGAPEQTHK